MIAKSIIRSVLLVVVLGSLAIWANREFGGSGAHAANRGAPRAVETLPAVEGPQVVMTYFLTGARCPTCRKIEALTRETAEKDFAAELAGGKLVFRVINTGEPENRHYLKDYQLTSKTVVLSRRADGRETGWKEMGKVWDLYDEPEGFRAYLGAQIREYLGS